MKHARSTLNPASAQFWFSYALSWLGRQCMAYIHGTWRGQLVGAMALRGGIVPNQR